MGSKTTTTRTEKSKWSISWNAIFGNGKVSSRWSIKIFKNEIPKNWINVKTNYVFEPFKWQKQQQKTQTVMYSIIYKAVWPSGLRRQTQENFPLEISGARMCAWIQNPLLSEVFKHCEVSHEVKNNAKSKAVLLLKAKRSREPDLKALDQNFCYTRMCMGSKTTTTRTEKSKWSISWNAIFGNGKVSCRWSIKIFKNEIPKNWINVKTNYVFEPFKWQKQQQKTQTVLYSIIYKAVWPSGLRRQTQENFPLEISGARMCAWIQNPLLPEVFKHCEVSHEVKNNAKSKAVLLLKAKRSREPDLKALDRNFCYTRMCVGSKPTPVETEKLKWFISWNAIFGSGKVSCRWSMNNF